MDEIEQKKAELEKLKSEPANSNEGNKPEEPELIKSANTSAERLEKATTEQKLENDRTEKLIAERRLGGRATGGVETPEQSEAIRKTNQAKEFFKDSALGDAITKTNE